MERVEDVCRTVPKLVSRLQVSYERKGNFHQGYHYYTTLSGLAYMLITHKLRLTNVTSPSLNDLKEPREFGDEKAWKRLCIACFSTRSEDYNPMWGLYGKPADEAICITIPPRVVKEIRKSGRCYMEKGQCKLTWADVEEHQKVAEFFVPLKGKTVFEHHDVAYFQNLYRNEEGGPIIFKLYRCGDCVAEFDLSHSGAEALRKLTGYAKRREWEYEDESRLRLTVPIECKKRHVYLELPGSFFRDVRITLGPGFDIEKRKLDKMPSASAKDVIDCFLRRRKEKEIAGAIKTSGYFGLLQYAGMLNDTSVLSKPKNDIRDRKKKKRSIPYEFHGKRIICECRSAALICKQLLDFTKNKGDEK